MDSSKIDHSVYFPVFRSGELVVVKCYVAFHSPDKRKHLKKVKSLEFQHVNLIFKFLKFKYHLIDTNNCLRNSHFINFHNAITYKQILFYFNNLDFFILKSIIS